MKKTDNQYLAGISSLKELKQAQNRVNKALRRSERRLEKQYYEAKETFSYRNIIEYAMTTIDNIQSVVQYAMKGYNLFRNRYSEND